jgi:hypothetical protein
MALRWLISLALALIVTGALAVGIAAGIQALLASQPPAWLDRWLPAASLGALLFGPIVMTISAYRRRKKKTGPTA